MRKILIQETYKQNVMLSLSKHLYRAVRFVTPAAR